MAVWTISAEVGTGGDRVAASLAAAAGVALLDRETLALYVRELDPDVPADELEERLGGGFNLLALSMAMVAGSVDAMRELQLRKTLPELGRAVAGEVARRPCVILAPAAFAALPMHPAAVHVRLHAPLEWRVRAYQRENVVDRRCAEKAVGHDDRVKSAWVRTLYGVDIHDSRRFSLVLDASRFSPDRLVEILLAAGGVVAAAAGPEVDRRLVSGL